MQNLKENSKEWWEARYENRSGSKEPSPFLVQHLDFLPPKAKVVDLACGEGRNAVALALEGHQVTAIDFSEKALSRAEQLAKDSGVQVNFKKQDLDFFLPELMSYDAIVCVDFRPAPTLLKNLVRGLRKDGHLLMEAFLTPICLERKDVEVFETFRPGELLRFFADVSASLRVVFYSEIGSTPHKVQLIAKKTEML